MTSEPGPVGNLYDKYGTRNPLARAVVGRFRRRIAEHLRRLGPGSVLDVGCGEGVLTDSVAAACPAAHVVGLDVPSPTLRSEWAARSTAVEFVEGSAYELPFADGTFDLATALELLEHLERPTEALAELRRVARRWVLLSVPREPLWGVLNVAWGRHLGSLGDTPGHVQHWSRRSFVRVAGGAGTVVSAGEPDPWTIVLVEVA
ncbi:MAG TPA: methyltransferase domain-containing protein [Gaiellaceae bacterium]|nr:methyltransferase domain-containing protein [Gaiellaceae bacterium]